jgi:hypothetical protein
MRKKARKKAPNKTVQRLLDEIDKDPWYIKLKRWFRLQIWVWKCLTRKYNIFKKK